MSEISDFLSDWKSYIPFYIAIYRWSLYIILKVIPSFFYRQLKYVEPNDNALELGTFIRKRDVTAVVAVYQPPDCFEMTIQSIVNNGPGQILVVSDVSCYEEIVRRCAKFEGVKVICEHKPGKRSALITGVKNTRTKIVALIDDDVQWSPKFLEKLIAPFQRYKNIGGVGCKHVARIESFWDVWRIMADMRLAVRYLELMACTVWDRGASCISGRTACYRTKILKCNEFYNYLGNEKFMGMTLQSGDDKCITRFVTNKGYKLYHQLRNSCKLSTTFERRWRFFKQMLRWARNTWRSDMKALFVERNIWFINPVTAFILLDKMFTPFFMLYGITYLPYVAIVNQQYVFLFGWVIWLFISRVMKLCYYLWDVPHYILYVPLFVLFQYVQAFVRIYALFTLYNRGWGTRDIKIKGNNVVRSGKMKVDLGTFPRRTKTGDQISEQKHNVLLPLDDSYVIDKDIIVDEPGNEEFDTVIDDAKYSYTIERIDVRDDIDRLSEKIKLLEKMSNMQGIENQSLQIMEHEKMLNDILELQKKLFAQFDIQNKQLELQRIQISNQDKMLTSLMKTEHEGEKLHF